MNGDGYLYLGYVEVDLRAVDLWIYCVRDFRLVLKMSWPSSFS